MKIIPPTLVNFRSMELIPSYVFFFPSFFFFFSFFFSFFFREGRKRGRGGGGSVEVRRVEIGRSKFKEFFWFE